MQFSSSRFVGIVSDNFGIEITNFDSSNTNLSLFSYTSNDAANFSKFLGPIVLLLLIWAWLGI